MTTGHVAELILAGVALIVIVIGVIIYRESDAVNEFGTDWSDHE